MRRPHRSEIAFILEAIELARIGAKEPGYGGHRHERRLVKLPEKAQESHISNLIRQAKGGRLTKYGGTACGV